MIYERWTTEYSADWAGRLTEFKRSVEAAMGGESKVPKPGK